jgi:hypothetical protein
VKGHKIQVQQFETIQGYDKKIFASALCNDFVRVQDTVLSKVTKGRNNKYCYNAVYTRSRVNGLLIRPVLLVAVLNSEVTALEG